MFDDEGRTRVVMITAEENGRIMLADWAPGLFARDWARRHRLRLRFADLGDASTWDEARLADLWHFDPWWVLGEQRYQGHGSVPTLRSTNIPGYDSTVSGIVFDPDLGRASYVVRTSGESVGGTALHSGDAGDHCPSTSRGARAATRRCRGRVAAAAVLALTGPRAG